MILVATYTATGDSFSVDKPRVWSDRQLLDSRTSGSNYDVSPDGKRIAALIPVENKDAKQVENQLIVLENFFDELRRKVPVGTK